MGAQALKKAASTVYEASQKMDAAIKKISDLTEAKTVNYLGDTQMLDLS